MTDVLSRLSSRSATRTLTGADILFQIAATFSFAIMLILGYAAVAALATRRPVRASFIHAPIPRRLTPRSLRAAP